jgi:hypothetical protein
MANLYQIKYGAMQTTAAPAVVATGAAIKTLLQIAPSSTVGLDLVAWGISFDASAAATPGKVELIETDVAASGGTAYVAADITKLNYPAGDASTVQLGAALSCFGPSTENSTTATRTFDVQLIAPTNQYQIWGPLGVYPRVQPSKFLRVRVTFGAGVNAYPWVIWQE